MRERMERTVTPQSTRQMSAGMKHSLEPAPSALTAGKTGHDLSRYKIVDSSRVEQGVVQRIKINDLSRSVTLSGGDNGFAAKHVATTDAARQAAWSGRNDAQAVVTTASASTWKTAVQNVSTNYNLEFDETATVPITANVYETRHDGANYVHTPMPNANVNVTGKYKALGNDRVFELFHFG